MSSDHSKLLSNLLIGILLLVGLVALPTVLQVQRSVLLEGEVTDVVDYQQSVPGIEGGIESSSNHFVRFKSPRTGTFETKVLHDIYKDKGESVRILFDPKDGSIEFDNFYRLYKTPSLLFGMLMLLWFMLFYILRSL